MENYTMIDVLASKDKSAIYKAKDLRTGKIVALKRNNPVAQEISVSPSMLREVSMLRELHSDYVVALEESFISKDKNNGLNVILVFEYLDYNLREFMRQKVGEGKPLSKEQSKNFSYQILLGLLHVHAQGIIHRDLEPSNLLIDDQRRRIKIAGFGHACKELPVGQKYSDRVLSEWYRPPEIFSGPLSYTSSIDVWNVGCIVVEMLTGRVFFALLSEITQTSHFFERLGAPSGKTWGAEVEPLQGWQTYSNCLKMPFGEVLKTIANLDEQELDLITKMLDLSPEKRSTVMQAICHPYFDSVRNDYPEPTEIKNSTHKAMETLVGGGRNLNA